MMDNDSYAFFIDVLLVLSLLLVLVIFLTKAQLAEDYGKCLGELKTYKLAEKPKDGVQ